MNERGELWGILPGYNLDRYAMASMDHLPEAQRREALSRTAEDRAPGYTVTAGGVAVVDLVGPMMRQVGGMARWLGFTSSRDVGTAVSLAARDRDVKSIVLNIDSPGGAVDGAGELAGAVRAARDVKPVVAQVDGLACSCGYWIASQASQVIATHGLDLVANIGVRVVMVDFSERDKQDGVRVEIIDTGALKSVGHPGRAITKADIQHVQGLVDEAFGLFAEHVMEGRGLSAEQFALVADGREVSAQDGVRLGLVDDIQPLGVTIEQLSGKAPRGRSRPSSLATAQATSMMMRSRADTI